MCVSDMGTQIAVRQQGRGVTARRFHVGGDAKQSQFAKERTYLIVTLLMHRAPRPMMDVAGYDDKK